jgi:hypothetical protein
MRFVEFSLAGLTNNPVYVNPALVVAVRRAGENQTYILVAAASADGKLAHLTVREDAQEVVAKLCG